jgi:hypothetical protein
MSEDVVKYQEALEVLQNKRAKTIERGFKLADERKAIAFDAHAGDDEKARRRLGQIHTEAVIQSNELASIDEAIATAAERLRAAEGDAALEQDRQEALAAREVLRAELMENGLKLNEALQILIEESAKQKLLFDKLRHLGVSSPRADMVRISSAHCVSTALMVSGWQKEVGSEFLAPGQRQNFATLYGRWAEAIEKELSRRIGDELEEKAA